MKKNIFISVILVAAISISGCKKIDLENFDKFNEATMEGANVTETPELKAIKESADYKLVRAFVDGDEKTIDEIINSGESGTIIDQIKSYEPFIKIRTYKDIQKALCVPSKACKKQHLKTKEDIEECGDLRASALKYEIEHYPGCIGQIYELHVVTSLCMLDSHKDMCVEEDPEYLMNEPEKRNQERTAQAQENYNCITKFMKNVNARSECIIDTPRHSKSEMDKNILTYCKNAVDCKIFSDIESCTAKYDAFFKNDKTSKMDCTDQHITSLTLEFDYLNHVLKLEDDFSHNLCQNIADYEKTVHVEELLDKSTNANEYTQNTLVVTNKPRDQIMISWFRIGEYVSEKTLRKMSAEDLNEYSKKQNEFKYALNYYSTCRIMNYSAKPE